MSLYRQACLHCGVIEGKNRSAWLGPVALDGTLTVLSRFESYMPQPSQVVLDLLPKLSPTPSPGRNLQGIVTTYGCNTLHESLGGPWAWTTGPLTPGSSE